MAEYCSTDDVKQVLASWEELGSAGFDAISDAVIVAAIVEASEQVRNDILPRYTVASIDAYSPDYPPGIVNLAKYKAGVLVLHQYGQVTDNQAKVILPGLYRQIGKWLRVIQAGTLLDDTGTVVPVDSAVSSLSSQSYTEGIDSIYANGTTRKYV